jgi:hypothetical protein
VYRGLQDTATPFYATLAANALNVVLGWAFIFGLGLGVKGAAAATVIAQVSAADMGSVSVSGESLTQCATLKASELCKTQGLLLWCCQPGRRSAGCLQPLLIKCNRWLQCACQ